MNFELEIVNGLLRVIPWGKYSFRVLPDSSWILYNIHSFYLVDEFSNLNALRNINKSRYIING